MRSPVTRPSTVWLVSVGLSGGLGSSFITAWPNLRLFTKATTAHPSGESTGTGSSVSSGPKPHDPNTPSTRPTVVGGVLNSGGAADIAGVSARFVCGTEKVLAVPDVGDLRRGGRVHRDIDDRAGRT